MLKISLLSFTVLLPGFQCFAVAPSQVDFEVSAQSVPRVALYYQDRTVTDKEINFPLVVNGNTQKFEQISDFFYVVGNVSNAEIIFADKKFVLHSVNDPTATMELQGQFIVNGVASSALQEAVIPVIRDMSQAKIANGFKVHFKSEFLAGNYAQDSYANTFTLLVMPVL